MPKTPIPPAAFQAALLRWYDAEKRDLPWRRKPAPYAILVSEFMLQQTRVDTAAPYFLRWMRLFPTIPALADAPEQDILAAWSGLGYYSRARNLHKLAKTVLDQHKGRIPSGIETLRSLPGIGQYTAAAVASIAFGLPVPALDANIRRVISRIGAIPGDVKTAPVSNRIETLAQRLISTGRPGDFNQALMDLGSAVCLPRPRCHECPISKHCAARIQGNPERYPQTAPPKPTVHIQSAAALITRRGRILLRRRPDAQPMPNLWELPGGPIQPNETPFQAATRHLREQTALRAIPQSERFIITHTFTHHRIKIHVIECQLNDAPDKLHKTAQWLTPADALNAPITGAARKIIRKIEE